jgi:hypothetical protein
MRIMVQWHLFILALAVDVQDGVFEDDESRYQIG